MVTDYFVPVLTDAPWSERQPRRNPELWEQSEAWKSKPLIGEITLLVKPDGVPGGVPDGAPDSAADRATVGRLDYHLLQEPELLQAWFVEVLEQDGVEVPNPTRAAIAVRMQLRAALRAMFTDDRTPHGQQRQRALSALVDRATARDLCTEAPALEVYTALGRDEAVDRAAAKVEVYRLHEAAERALGAPAGPRAFLLAQIRGGRLATTLELQAVAAALRTELRLGLAAAPAGRAAPDAELLEQLRELHVVLPAGAGAR